VKAHVLGVGSLLFVSGLLRASVRQVEARVFLFPAGPKIIHQNRGGKLYRQRWAAALTGCKLGFPPLSNLVVMSKTKKQINLTNQQRDKIIKAVQDVAGTREYFSVTGCLWEVLRYMVINPPKRRNKWSGLRWLFSQLSKFALNDYKK
jgi:hypothetical protein